jgi:hypothetical protein
VPLALAELLATGDDLTPFQHAHGGPPNAQREAISWPDECTPSLFHKDQATAVNLSLRILCLQL